MGLSAVAASAASAAALGAALPADGAGRDARAGGGPPADLGPVRDNAPMAARAEGDPLVEAADRALRRGDWADAVAAYESALRDEPSAEAQLGLALALWCGYRIEAALSHSRQAFRRFQAEGKPERAAWVAGWIAFEEAAIRGNRRVAHGWFRRAARLLAGRPETTEGRWLDLWRAVFEGEPRRLLNAASAAVEASLRLGDPDLAVLARAERGLALISLGDLDEGIAELDEAMVGVVAGEASHPLAVSDSLCALLTACERTHDYGRAEEWCHAAREAADRRSIGFLGASCRVTYGWLLGVLGEWDEAEAELTGALDTFSRGHPELGSAATLHLAELRRRQGRPGEALTLLGTLPDGPDRQRVAAEVALDTGRWRDARDLAMGVVRSAGGARVDDVALLLRAAVAAGDGPTALDALRRIDEDQTRHTPAVDAMVWLARAAAARAGLLDADPVALCDRAAELFRTVGAEWDAGRAARARSEAVARGTQAQGGRRRHGRAAREGRGPLTPRQVQVLRELADGHSDSEAAAALGLSRHTVHRHVANIFDALTVSSRTSAVAEAIRRGLL